MCVYGRLSALCLTFVNRQNSQQAIIWMKIIIIWQGWKRYLCVLWAVKGVTWLHLCVRAVKESKKEGPSCFLKIARTGLYSGAMSTVISDVNVSVNVLSVHVHECGKVHIHPLHRLSYDFNGAIWQVRAPCHMCFTEFLLFTFSLTFRKASIPVLNLE